APFIGLVHVSYALATVVGPRSIHGSVSLRFDGSRPYSFVSRAQWPDSGNYENAVRTAVEGVLLDKLGSLDRVAVALPRIQFDPIHSCQVGFERAARRATLSLFAD